MLLLCLALVLSAGGAPTGGAPAESLGAEGAPAGSLGAGSLGAGSLGAVQWAREYEGRIDWQQLTIPQQQHAVERCLTVSHKVCHGITGI